MRNVANAPRPTILIVDDVPVNIDVLRAALERDFTVQVAVDGRSALEVAAGPRRPDLVLLDVMLPDIDGFEVCRRLRAEVPTRRIPVIFVTSLQEAAYESRGFEAGGVDYLTKPVNPLLVRARVGTHLELAAARRDLELQNEVLRENLRLREEIDQIGRHDLKNPLTTVLSVPSVLLAAGTLTPRQADLLRLVRQAGQRMLEMINRTIDLGKMERGSYEVRPVAVDLVPLLGTVRDGLARLGEDKHVRFELARDGGLVSGNDTFPVQAEELLLYSLFSNLIANAIEASPRGATVTVDLRTPSTVAIANQGAVPVSIRGRFFEKYATAGKSGGTGIGAYSARLMARTLGGDVTMSTSEEAGTLIMVTLPTVPA